MRNFINILALCVLTFCTFSAEASAIRIVGSSTVFPFVTAAAEQFGQGSFKTPIVESTGTGGGFKLFCAGSGGEHADMNNASRKITPSEIELCKKNGITRIIELPIGYDGIVLANAASAPKLNLTRQEIFLALARDVPGADGKLVKNAYETWNQINPKLPHLAITIYGPPPTSGTRDAFVELVMEKGCEKVAAFEHAYPDTETRKKNCGLIREDGKFIEAGEDDNLIIQKLAGNHDALGILGYGFLEENKGRIRAASIEGVEPTFANVENGSYSVSRSLYVYIKGEHLGKTPGLAEFTQELISESAIGEDGYLIDKGLLPLHAEERAQAEEMVKGIR